MVWSTIPFSLFPLVDVDVKDINKILSAAFESTEVYAFWLCDSTSYASAPQKTSGVANEGQKPPISSSYKSPFLGKKVEDVADWLRNKPDDVDLDKHFFAVLDKTAEAGKVVVCRIGGRELKNLSELDFMRHDAPTAALRLRTAQPNQWEEEKEQKGEERIEY